MNRIFALGAFLVCLLGVVAPAAAQANRTFVSGHGSDSNPCSLLAPCRSFAQAITQTSAGGEIAVLDTAGYGPVTINKAISIFAADGIEAGVTAAGPGDGIVVAAGPTDIVNLRGLVLTGGGVGGSGIRFNSGAALNIDHCTVGGFTQAGIVMSTAAAAKMSVTDTTAINDNVGFYVIPTAGPAQATLSDVHATSNSNAGIIVDLAQGTIPNHQNNNVAILGSLVDNNGLAINAAVGATAILNFVMLDNSKLISNTGFGNLTNFGVNNNSFAISRSAFMGAGGFIGTYHTNGNNQAPTAQF